MIIYVRTYELYGRRGGGTRGDTEVIADTFTRCEGRTWQHIREDLWYLLAVFMLVQDAIVTTVPKA